MAITYLCTTRLGADLGISPRTLEKWRVEGNGPRFIKAGRRVLYDIADVKRWLAANSYASTSAAAVAAEGVL